MNEIIIIIAVIVLLLVILSFLLFFVTKRVNLLMKNTFVDKLNEFDFLIKDKENKISELNEEISNKETQLKKLDEQIKELSSKDYSKKSSDVVLPRYADLEDGNLLSSYKKIKK